MSATRQRRTNDVSVTELSNLERLIFSQAVHEFGSNSWVNVAKLLSKHPLLSRPKHFFTPQSCNLIYRHLMDSAGLISSDSDLHPRSPAHLTLARKHYDARIVELRGLIASEEHKFKTIVTEIDEIRSGKWDNKIMENLGIKPVMEEKPLVNGDLQHAKEVAGGLSPQAALEAIVEKTPSPVPEIRPFQEPPTAELKESHTEVETVKGPIAVEEAVPETQEGMSPKPTRAESIPIEPEVTPEESVQLEAEPEPALEEQAIEETAAPLEVQEEAEVSVSVKAESPFAVEVSELREEGPEVIEEPEAVMAEVVSPETIEPLEAELPRDGKRKAADLEGTPAAEGPRKRAREESEATEGEEAGPSPVTKLRRKSTTEAPVISKKFQNVIGMLHKIRSSRLSRYRETTHGFENYQISNQGWPNIEFSGIPTGRVSYVCQCNDV
ncbi:unnamed protein product [Somion occarium]|uniref:Uncharacterized protein n=1 Tax=Somion occarium TaxID=3059160 RepID=A0ABP1D0M0_9APHY